MLTPITCSKIPWKMVSFLLWFPGSLLSREWNIAFALCTRCKNSTPRWLCTQAGDGSQPTDKARLLCPCRYLPTGCQPLVLSAETRYFASGSRIERMDNLFPSNSSKQRSAVFIRRMLLLSTTNFTSYKIRRMNIFKSSTVQMERTMVNVKYTEVRWGLFSLPAECWLNCSLH